MSEWQQNVQSQRHFSHRSQGRTKRGKAGGGGGGAGSKGDVFEPRKMLGEYVIRSPFFEQLCRQHEGDACFVGSKNSEGKYDMRLFIHELVDTQDGYIASFDFGVIEGHMYVAGSRKALSSIVSAAETSADTSTSEDRDDASSEGPIEEHTEHDSHRILSREQGQKCELTESNRHFDETDTCDDSGTIGVQFERPPEEARPAHAFEKNTFRTPKWFGQWRGRWNSKLPQSQCTSDEHEDALVSSQSTKTVETSCGSDRKLFNSSDKANKAHFEFATAACRQFEATISCPSLGARESPMQGWKVSNKPPRLDPHWTWNDHDEV